MHELHPKKTHLFTPGPTPVPDPVLRAMAAPLIHHRTAAFQERFSAVLAGLQQVIGTSSDVAVYSASGTGAMESAIANLVSPGDQVIVAAFGRFGERWGELATRYGATVHLHETAWGQRPDADSIAAFASLYPKARVVFTTHSETSTGTVSDSAAIARALRAEPGGADRILVLDAISGLGAAPLNMDTEGWDVVVSGSQKALMVPPGLAFAAISPRAEQHAVRSTSPRMYFDWAATLAAQRKSPPSTAFTPAITIVLGLEVALTMILKEEGLDNVFARHVRLGRAARAGVQALGFDLYGPDDDSSCVLTAVKVPSGVDGARIPAQLREYGVTIAGGQAHVKGKIFRIGHCGWINDLDLVMGIAALERACAELGIDVPVGAGVAAAQRSLTLGEAGVIA